MFNSTVLCALILLLSALMLHYFLVIEENFQVQRTPSRRPVARARTRRPAAAPPAPAPAPAPAPTPAPTPALPSCPTCPPCPAATAASIMPTTTVVPPTITQVTAEQVPQTPQTPQTQPADLAKIDQITAPARGSPQPSMPFSELVNTLITYKPIENAQQVYGQPVITKSSLDGTSVNNMTAIPAQDLSRDVKKIRMGVKDIQNILKSERNQKPVTTRTPQANSNALEQGKWFRSKNDGVSPYGMGQQADAAFRPVDDMSEYIRKDSIPCWGCTLK
jgi:hypothetical protein